MNTFLKVIIFVIFVILVIFAYTQLTKKPESEFALSVDYLTPYNNITEFLKRYNCYYKRLFDIYIASRVIKPNPIRIIKNESPDKSELIEYYNSIIDNVNYFIEVAVNKLSKMGGIPLLENINPNVSDTKLTKDINNSINAIIKSIERTELPPWYKRTIPIKKNKGIR